MITLGLVKMGYNTLWLMAHHIVAIALVLAIADYVLGAVFFSTEPRRHAALHMRIGSSAAIAFAILVVITGIVPDVEFGNSALFTHTVANSYGTMSLHATEANLGAFAGPLLFDMMEHVSLIVPGLTVIIAVLCWSFGKDIVVIQHYRRAVISLTVLTFTWIAVLAVIGIYLAKFLTFPVTA